ncbi:MAG: hypothetical protein DWQ47_10795 [Acidobacteria bacterium]|nr:MAG: hypothetical protein DWQ32_13210 [Acidobacteriota bacterium]REJ98072.1 MAG: hypothetical protein DWQ38_16010 [Acidobacteriota bacterium]REK16815.1 MAG: hypothetical protein DWQ43_01055 [Acidobacteriota bacterium]REK42726.1 MAG: hypothetical protein DWQ47_10795 [Acidobacteriota bacterium]
MTKLLSVGVAMKAFLILTILAIGLILSGIAFGQDLETRIKAIDGVLKDGEVAYLEKRAATDEITILSRDDGEFISIAVKTAPHFVASICLASADDVIVLHASAALGELEYLKKDGAWDPNGKFEWKVRDTSMGPEAIQQRTDYFQMNKWVANTTPMGTKGETEFLVRKDILSGEDLMLAVGIMPESDPEKIISFPEEPAGCGDRMLVSGNSERKGMRFDTSSWIRIR